MLLRESDYVPKGLFSKRSFSLVISNRCINDILPVPREQEIENAL